VVGCRSMVSDGSPASCSSSVSIKRSLRRSPSPIGLKPLRQIEWVIYAKRPFTGPDAVLAYLSRYTHRVAIAISRLIAMNEQGITFKWKDYRAKEHYPVVITPSLYKYSSQLHPHRQGVGKMGITLL